MHKKSSNRYSKLIVLLCLVNIMWYTVTCFWFMWNGKDISDVLTAFFFVCFGIEFGSLAFIKSKEYRYVSGDKVGHIERIEEQDEKDF